MAKTCFKQDVSKEKALCMIADAIRDLASAVRDIGKPEFDIKWPPVGSGESQTNGGTIVKTGETIKIDEKLYTGMKC